MVPHLIPKLRNKTPLKVNNLGHVTQNWTSIVESNWIFFKLYLLIYIYMTYKLKLFFFYGLLILNSLFFTLN